MTPRREWIDRLRYGIGFLRSEFRSKLRPPLGVRLRMLSRGFLGESYIMYGLDRSDPALYLSDYARFLCQRLNGSFSAVLENKIAFTGTFGRFIGVPSVRAVISRGRVLPHDPETALDGIDAVLDAVRAGDRLVIKPFGGLQGRGVWMLSFRADALRIDDQPASEQQVRERFAELDECIVTDCIVQHAYAQDLFLHSVNTIRLYTMIDPADGEAFIPMAAQRIGTAATAPVDNWSRGGIAAMIDLPTGTLGRACGYPRSGRVEWHDTHPDGGAQITGAVVAHWPEVCRAMLDLAARFPFMRFVGWDVVVTPDSFVVLEGNDAGFNLVQMHQPLLANERIRRCLRQWKIIRA